MKDKSLLPSEAKINYFITKYSSEYALLLYPDGARSFISKDAKLGFIWADCYWGLKRLEIAEISEDRDIYYAEETNR